MKKDFISALNDALTNSKGNISITENGAIGYSTTGKKILDLNFQIPSLRNLSEKQIVDKFVEAYLEEPVVATLWLFYVRDVREGLGERRLFRACLPFIAKKVDVKGLIELIPDYGRFDDIFLLMECGYKKEVISFIREQIVKDIKNKEANKPISLLAKWLKSENTSSKESRNLAHEIREGLGLNSKDYRQLLSNLRKYIDVTEVKMSAKEFDQIDYSKVPSKASLNYKEAFKRNDGERYQAYIDSVNKGEAKINAATLYPHEIVHKYTGSYGNLKSLDPSLEALWKNLPDLVKGDETTLVVADGSGSMTCRVGQNSSVTALDVANGLALYFAQRAKGPFKNTYITFSETPQLVRVGSGSLYQDLRIARKHDEVANTNIEATFDLILNTAVQNKMKQEDLPKNILIISDMEFDSQLPYGFRGEDKQKALFKVIESRYRAAGYALPRLVFWNVNSRTNSIPVKENASGVVLVSGFSTNIIKMVLNGELDPYANLLKTLFSERYQAVIELLVNEDKFHKLN